METSLWSTLWYVCPVKVLPKPNGHGILVYESKMLKYGGLGFGSEMAIFQDARGAWLVRESTVRLVPVLM